MLQQDVLRISGDRHRATITRASSSSLRSRRRWRWRSRRAPWRSPWCWAAGPAACGNWAPPSPWRPGCCCCCCCCSCPRTLCCCCWHCCCCYYCCCCGKGRTPRRCRSSPPWRGRAGCPGLTSSLRGCWLETARPGLGHGTTPPPARCAAAPAPAHSPATARPQPALAHWHISQSPEYRLVLELSTALREILQSWRADLWIYAKKYLSVMNSQDKHSNVTSTNHV